MNRFLRWAGLPAVVGIAFSVQAATPRFEKLHSPELKPEAIYPLGANGFFLPGAAPEVILVLRNRTKKSLPVRVSCILKDYSGAVLEQKELVIPKPAPGARYRKSVKFAPPKKSGYFPVEFRIFSGKKLVAESSTAFAVASEQPEKRDPFFGLLASSENLLEGCRRIGVGTLSVSIHAQYYVNGHYPRTWFKSRDWKKWMDYRLSQSAGQIAADDFKIVGTVGPHVMLNKTMEKRVKEGFFPLTDQQLQIYFAVAKHAACLLRDRVKFWIIQEEIDASYRCNPPRAGSGLGTLYANVLATRKIYQGIKKGNPDANVAVLGINGDDYFINKPPFLATKMILQDLDPYFDFICIDAYSGTHTTKHGARLGAPEFAPRRDGRTLKNFLTDTAELSASYGRPRVAVNAERGYATDYSEAFNSPDNREAADFIARSLIITRATPTILNMQFLGGMPSHPENIKRGRWKANEFLSDYGLWKVIYDENGKFRFIPRPAAMAHATVARELAFSSFERELRPTDKIYAYLFRKPDRSRLAVLWTVGSTPITVRFKLPKGGVRDLQGNVRKFAAGEQDFRLTGSPLFITLPEKTPALATRLTHPEFPGLLPVSGSGLRSGGDRLTLVLINHITAMQKITPLLDGRKEKPVTVRPGKALVLRTAMAKKVELLLPDGKIAPVPVNDAFIGVPQNTNPRKGRVVALPFPAAIRPQSALIPELALFKHDGSDISAKLFLSWDKEAFHLAADVRDPVHIQRYSGKNIWKDDALQFVISSRFDCVPEAENETQNPLNRFGKATFNFGLARTANGVELYQFGGGGRTPGARAFPARVERGEKMTRYTVSIPWRALGITPKRGLGIRFAAVIFDNNRLADASALYHLAFGSGVAGGQNLAGLKTLILE